MVQIVEQDLHPDADLVYIKMEAQPAERSNISSLKCENILPSLTFLLVIFLQLSLFLGARISISSYAVWESQPRFLILPNNITYSTALKNNAGERRSSYTATTRKPLQEVKMS